MILKEVPYRELYVLHTNRKEINISERKWTGGRGDDAAPSRGRVVAHGIAAHTSREDDRVPQGVG